MKVVIERNANAFTRGATAPELVILNVAARLVGPQEVTSYLGNLDNATGLGADLLEAVDLIPGIDAARAERYRLFLTVSKAFDADEVLAEVVQAIERMTGEAVDQ